MNFSDAAEMEESDAEDLMPTTDALADVIEGAVKEPLEKINPNLDFFVSEAD